MSEVSPPDAGIYHGQTDGVVSRDGNTIRPRDILTEIAEDHVHLFIQTDPSYSPAEVAKQLKGHSGKEILERHLELREAYFWGSGLWKDGYYVGTTGNVSAEVVRRYIEETEY